jgi:O-antigen/teichoic acid export membrane protein
MAPLIRRSLAFSFLENYSVMALSLASAMILARILTPEQIGIFSVGAVVVAIAQLLRDFGVGQYLTQVKDLTIARLRAAFALQLTVSVGLAALLALLSQPLAQFYGREELKLTIPLLALNLVLIPFSSILLAWYRREFQYRASFIVSIVGTAGGLIVSTGAALLGLGYMALVWGSLATSVATVIVANVYRPSWFPWLPSFKGVAEIFRFGGYASAAGVVQEGAYAAPDLVIGKALGVADVAIFGKAAGVVAMFSRLVMRAVWSISTPAFAKQRHAGEDWLVGYTQSLRYLTALAWPFFAFIAVMALPVVRVLFGDQWDAAVPLVRVLALQGAITITFGLVTSLLMAHGKVREQFELQTVSAIVSIALLLAAVHYGLAAVAAAATITAAFTLAYSTWLLRRTLDFSPRLLITSVLPSLPLAAAVGLAAAGTLVVYPHESQASGWTLIPATAASALAWLLTVAAVKHPILAEVTNMTRLLRSWRLRSS